ncbi:DUF4254 domain-containing protein [Legionella jordanis]|uniref:DUF4254 domain-containing protein n=1 Tax=Legionella jordanis TaxID=456 RepID=A0A0W0VD04_9GAMM|nr:DUF4254 domain-containing protein [Legionella jordanis]KTD17998.1 hypothetical protein Ljor_2304 [Legionella jordanis]RMX02312.1 DUF4254 domain-containing protein [Legionella jordanis]RMX21203.1 DUF4254 domain-containing protein [Legionella jordanis]VEH13910.1 Uncharacterised protein [Legionella jordanis]HAT8714290.1 DUF4254 domain-containing protein [Legionella jordanis]
MTQFIDVNTLALLHEDCIVRWKQAQEVQLSEANFLAIVEQNHAFNYRLWHAEDRARRDDMGFEFVYHAKREIDYCNQQRNNCMEAMDEWLYRHLNPANPADCPVHSETPGMMIDRLSILALKAYHMHLQTQREDVTEQHRQNCLRKWQTILEQQKQLRECLDYFLAEINLKTRTFRIYQQFKMYNDPSLNPELYKK